MRSYEAARKIYSFLGFCAWCTIVIGAIVAAAGMAAGGASGFGREVSSMAAIIGALPGLGIAFGGFVALAIVQNGRATVDTAELTQQMLRVARDQLEISQQALKQGREVATSYQQVTAAASTGSDGDNPATSLPDGSAGVGYASQNTNSPLSLDDPMTVPERAEDTFYKQKHIRGTDGQYLDNGMPFDTLDKAKQYIDTLESTGSKPLPGATRT